MRVRLGLGLVAVCVGAVVATAQPVPSSPIPPAGSVDRGYVALGFVLGTSDLWIHSGLNAEGGIAIPQLPLRIRGLFLLRGGSEQSDWSGDFTRYGVGVEARTCNRLLCGFLDLDVGYQSQTLTDDNSGRLQGSRSGPLVGPRLGGDAGGQHVRFRAALELYRFKTHHDPSVWRGSNGISLALAYQF